MNTRLTVNLGATVGIYRLTLTDATGDELARAERIISATLLQIQDKAPLFTGGAPANTNPFDINNYGDNK